MTTVSLDQFRTWYGPQGIDAEALRQTAAGRALVVADRDGDGEIADQPRSPGELQALFERMSNGNNAVDLAHFSFVTALMRQKRGEDPPLGTRSLRDVESLAPIFAGRPGAKLVKVSGPTVGTGSVQDALNEIATHEERARGGGWVSPLRVDTSGGRNRSHYGNKTAAAVAAFRVSVGLSDRGEVDRDTLDALATKLDEVRAPATTTPPAPAPSTGRLRSPRFEKLPIFAEILRGAKVLARGAKGDAVDMLQLTLYSLGFDIGRAWVDADFGGSTEAALDAFQAQHGLPRTKVLETKTLEKLDELAVAQTAALKAKEKPIGSKHDRFDLVVDKVRGRTQRIYVLDTSGEPVASYKTSPGTDAHPTPNRLTRITHTHVMKPWNPPASDWAANASVVPPGPRNPMGVLKLRIDGSAILFHGTTKNNEALLGRPASHGCMRMSPTNIIHLFENYAEAGTDVRVNVSAADSDVLAAKARARGIVDEDVEAGREYVAAYVGRELGRDEIFRGGRTLLA